MEKEKKKIKWETPELIKFDRNAVGQFTCNGSGGGETCDTEGGRPFVVIFLCQSNGSQQLINHIDQ